MKIKHVRAIPTVFKIEEKFQQGYSRGWSSNRNSVIVVVETEDGTLGFGDCYYPALPVSTVINELLRPTFIGRSIFDKNDILDDIYCGRYTTSRRGLIAIALSGLDMALWDLIGKYLKQPVYKILGGKVRSKVAAYASCGHFTKSAGISDKKLLEKDAINCIEKKFKGIKVKLGKSIDNDFERIKLVREIVGDKFPIMVDYNGNYTRDLAIRSINKISPFEITWAEEPLPPEDIEGYVVLRKNSPIPIAVGEAEESSFDIKNIIVKGAADIIMPDLSKCGGITAAWDIVRLARFFNIKVSPHVWSTGIGLAASIHLCISMPKYPHTIMIPDIYPWLEFDTSPNDLRTNILVNPIKINNEGYIETLEGVGLGIEIDWKNVEKYTMDS